MSDAESHTFDGVKRHMARGTAWMIAMRWCVRAIGLLNTIILARLLAPEDFGIIAMATVIIGFLEVSSDFNVDLALLRNQSATRRHYNSAWTLQICTRMGQAILLCLLAPIVASYYGDPRVELVIYVIALRPAIQGFENIGQVDFRRSFNFKRDFAYWTLRRLIAFALTLGIVLWLRDYMALAIAQPISATVTVILSFLMSPYRPRIGFHYIGEIWSFSKWWLVLGVVRFLGNRGDEFVLGGVAPARTVGAYYIAGDISGMATREVVMPAGRAMIPAYARVSENQEELRRTFSASFGVLVAFCLAAGAGASLLASDIVGVVLGDKWLEAIPFFQWLALHGAFWSIVQSAHPYFIVAKRERNLAVCNLGYLAVLVPVIVGAAHLYDAETVAFARMCVTVAYAVAMLVYLGKTSVLSLHAMVALLWRPFVATAAMAAVLIAVDLPDPAVLRLFGEVAIGFSVFVLTLLALWLISGRPQGVESTVLDMLFRSRRAAHET